MKAIFAFAVAGFFLAPAGTGDAGGQPSVRVVRSITLPDEIAGSRIRELSGLAYNPASNVLWAVSDHGELHEFLLQFNDGVPIGVSLASSVELGLGFRSAEGLAYTPSAGAGQQGRLLIAFEDGPAIISRSIPGDSAVQLPLPPPLDNPTAYAEENSRLEAVATDVGGRFFTAPEEALKDRPDTEHTIFAEDASTIRIPTFQAHRSNLKAIEYLADAGKLLILERTRDDASVSTMRLRLVDLNSCTREKMCAVIELLPDRPDTFVGNFEGLTRLGGNYFAAVTDSNPKKNETTRIVFFEINLDPAIAPGSRRSWAPARLEGIPRATSQPAACANRAEISQNLGPNRIWKR